MGKNGKLLNLNSDSPKYGNKSLVTKEQENELKRVTQKSKTLKGHPFLFGLRQMVTMRE